MRVRFGLVDSANVVAVFGGVVLQCPGFVPLLTLQLENRENPAKFTDDPVLKQDCTRVLKIKI